MDPETLEIVPVAGEPLDMALLPDATLRWAGNDTVLLHAAGEPMLLTLEPGIAQVSPPDTLVQPWQITDERLLDVEADRVTLSPDGEWIAGMGPGESICVWDVPTLTPACAGEGLPIREDTVTWSPDGTAVAFALDATFQKWESDIYLFDRVSGELRNLTDDGMEGDLLGEELAGKNPPLDDVPVWLPDGERIAFVRSYAEGESQSTTIMVVDRAGGEPVELARLGVDDPFVIWTPMFWLADGRIVYSWNELDIADANNGVWSVGVDDGSSPVQIVPGGEGSVIAAPILSDVAGSQALVYSWSLMGSFPPEGGVTAFWAIDLASGAPTPLPLPPGEPDMLLARRVIDAGFSPDGGTVLLVTDASDGPVLMTMGSSSREISPLDLVPREGAILSGTPQWAANDTVLIHTWEGPLLLTLEPAT
jgi:WD40 repeat protein